MSIERPGISLEEWYPIIRGLVPTPVTQIIKADADLLPISYYDGNEELGRIFEVTAERVREAGNAVGWPMFLRTGLTSAKHGWRDTCYVPDPASVARHMANIIDYSATADFMGLPCDIWVARELLPTTPVFLAFDGMPVTKERRYFIHDHEVVGWHPYWPEDAFKTEGANPNTINWQEALHAANKTYNQSEVDHLMAQTGRIAKVMPGAWSVDWLYVRGRGWFLTDMAWAEKSWVMWDYKTAPDPARLLSDVKEEESAEADLEDEPERPDPVPAQVSPQAPAGDANGLPRRARAGTTARSSRGRRSGGAAS